MIGAFIGGAVKGFSHDERGSMEFSVVICGDGLNEQGVRASLVFNG